MWNTPSQYSTLGAPSRPATHTIPHTATHHTNTDNTSGHTRGTCRVLKRQQASDSRIDYKANTGT